MYILWYIIGIVSSILPVVLIKYWTTHRQCYWLLISSVLLYVLLVYAYATIFTTKNISTTYNVLETIANSVIVIIGVVIFGELLSYTNIIGLILAIGGVILLSM